MKVMKEDGNSFKKEVVKEICKNIRMENYKKTVPVPATTAPA